MKKPLWKVWFFSWFSVWYRIQYWRQVFCCDNHIVSYRISLNNSLLYFWAMRAILLIILITSFALYILEINLCYSLPPLFKGVKNWKRSMGVWAPLLYCHDVGRIQHSIETEIIWNKINVISTVLNQEKCKTVLSNWARNTPFVILNLILLIKINRKQILKVWPSIKLKNSNKNNNRKMFSYIKQDWKSARARTNFCRYLKDL